MHILITGGTGYIGSHTAVELLGKGHTVTIADNFSRSRREVPGRIRRITGKEPALVEMDLCDREKVRSLLSKNRFDAVIHFAAFKAVGESVEHPMTYYRNNLVSLINLAEAMQEAPSPHLVFSSSCSVYGEPERTPVNESTPLCEAQSPYGNTKQIGEEILRDTCLASPLRTIALRYFNPAGAHSSGLLGEFPIDPPNNLVPVLMETAIGKRKEIQIFGSDYNTPDGTCIRDYIHVTDVALAHIAAIDRLVSKKQRAGFEVFNIGAGQGNSVLEVLKCFEETTNIKIRSKMSPRRPGDVVRIYSDNSLAAKELGWKTTQTLADILRSAWQWEQNKKNS